MRDVDRVFFFITSEFVWVSILVRVLVFFVVSGVEVVTRVRLFRFVPEALLYVWGVNLSDCGFPSRVRAPWFFAVSECARTLRRARPSARTRRSWCGFQSFTSPRTREREREGGHAPTMVRVRCARERTPPPPPRGHASKISPPLLRHT